MTQEVKVLEAATICTNCGLAVRDGVPQIVLDTDMARWIASGWKPELCLYCAKKNTLEKS